MTLKEARLALGLSQRELDRRAGVGRNTTTDIELGNTKHPSWYVVQRITQALKDSGLKGITAEEVFGGIESRPTP